MAKNRTLKSCYESRYGGGWITAAKRLAEMACERAAGDNTLGSRFWMRPPWDKVFIREVTFANRLLATPFAFEAIVRALVSRDGRRVRTLGAPFFKPMIEIEQRKLDLEQQRLDVAVIPEAVDTLEKPRPIKRAGKSIREKVELDGPNQRGLFDNENENESS